MTKRSKVLTIAGRASARAALVTIPLALAVGMLDVPANAATKTFRDGSDGYAVAPQNNIVAVRVNNGPTNLKVNVRLKKLPVGKRAYVQVAVQPATGPQWILSAKRTTSGRTKAAFQEPTNDEFGGVAVACQGFKVSWNRKAAKVTFMVPQRCVASSAQKYTFKAIAGFWTYKSPGDWTNFFTVKRG